MDTDTAEYLLAMACSYATVGTGLLQQLEDTVQSGSVCVTLRWLREYGYFEVSPAGGIAGLTPEGFELLHQLRALRRTARRGRRLNGRSPHPAAAVSVRPHNPPTCPTPEMNSTGAHVGGGCKIHGQDGAGTKDRKPPKLNDGAEAVSCNTSRPGGSRRSV